MKSNLRVKRRDPWHRANALRAAVADPALSGEDAKQKVADVSPPGSQADGATISPSELKSLTQIPVDRKALDGPATRPNTPLAVENSVGKLAAPLWRGRLIGCRLPDAILHGKRSHRPRSRAVQHLTVTGLLSEAFQLA
jgi:hypothetical protein